MILIIILLKRPTYPILAHRLLYLRKYFRTPLVKRETFMIDLETYNEETDGTLLTVSAEIFSVEPEGFEIHVTNDEKNEKKIFTSTRGYAEYLIESVDSSRRDNFIAPWLPSPHARRYDIDLIGMELSMMQEWMEKELGEAQMD